MDEREKELLRKVRSGDSSAFEELVLPHRRSLLHLAYRMIGNMEEAMDVVQETMLRSFQYLHRFNPEKNFRNWLFQIAVNKSRDLIRKMTADKNYWQKMTSLNKPEFNDESNEISYETASHQSSARNLELKLDVNKCLNHPGPRERQVFILRDLEGLSIKETSTTLGMSNISVRVNLSSARKKIRLAITGHRAKTSGSGEDE
jgi:RNA polymerase sigma-70 factor (ECF subfamily)